MEFAPHGITANSIPPPLIDTPMPRDPLTGRSEQMLEAVAAMMPVRRAGTAEDVAATCAFLCSHGRQLHHQAAYPSERRRLYVTQWHSWRAKHSMSGQTSN
jgi:NAD(P)-dependent dehydrogenase (short-subunit alcohol dehydrogenase family)